MQMPAGRQQPLPYLLTILPPFFLAGVFPDLFFQVGPLISWQLPGSS